MLIKFRLIALACAFIAFSGLPVAAQVLCAPYETVRRALEGRRYEESRNGFGFSGERRIELWVSQNDKKTFTILVIENGIACLPVSGEGWQFETPKPPGSDS